MDTGKLRNNNQYYEGFEGEDEIVMSLENDPEYSIHIWTGYIDSILSDPVLDGKGWKGMTRDYHQLEGPFAEDGKSIEIDPEEYLEDLCQYEDKPFDEPETADVLQLILSFLDYAKRGNYKVRIEVN